MDGYLRGGICLPRIGGNHPPYLVRHTPPLHFFPHVFSHAYILESSEYAQDCCIPYAGLTSHMQALREAHFTKQLAAGQAKLYMQ